MVDATRASVARLFAYGFRPFFLLAAGYGVVMAAAWAAMLAGLLPPLPGDALAWHVFEMVYGVTGAALAGFLLTAVPEFTGARPVTGRPLAALVGLWLAARLALWSAGGLGLAPAALLNLAFLAGLFAAVAPPLWSDPRRRHRVFAYLLATLWFSQALVFAAWLQWLPFSHHAALNVAVAVFLLLIVAAVSRIGMRVVNDELDGLADERRFLARPPRRNLAMALIALFAGMELFLPQHSVTGWVALAAAAAVLNLLNDWHLGRVLARPYVATLYAIYWLMALGLALIGLDYLWGLFPANHARHLLTVGTMGLAVLAVLCIAGLAHTGRALAAPPLLRAALFCVAAAALLRAFAPVLVPEALVPLGYGLPALLWCLGFGLYLALFAPMLLRPRADGLPG